jgi:hypothetical protein
MAMKTNLAEMPVSGAPIQAPAMTDEEQRKLCFDLFNQYWENAYNRGIPFEAIGTMSISASLIAIVAKFGTETTAEFVEDLLKSIREDEFDIIGKRN